IFPAGTRLPEPGEPAIETTLEYAPCHNIAHLRYVECAATDEQGVPVSGVRPWSQAYFPYDPAVPFGRLRDDVVIVDRPDLLGTKIRETYSCDADGVITVKITRCLDGQSATFEVFNT
ncbi:MAG: hypothetical protein C0404_03900, partial [Verrucomicrobia bacterium]|nr:hypothetical protein [Verrucomicrobiota bacterium]